MDRAAVVLGSAAWHSNKTNGEKAKGKNLAAHSPKSNLEPDAALGSGA